METQIAAGPAKTRRPPRTYMLYTRQTKRGLEYQVLHGNKVVARYVTHDEAAAHLDRILKP
jgi:hypothetical protein